MKMKLFLILLISVFVVYGLSMLNMSMLFTNNKTRSTNGIVIGTQRGYHTTGDAYSKYVDYIFFIEGEVYSGRKIIEIRDKKQHIGNTLIVNYSVVNPNASEVIKFNNEFNSSKERSFLSVVQKNYNLIKLVNGIYFFRKYEGGKLLKEEKGIFKEEKNELHLITFLKNNKSTFRFNSEKGLINLKTKRIYK